MGRGDMYCQPITNVTLIFRIEIIVFEDYPRVKNTIIDWEGYGSLASLGDEGLGLPRDIWSS